MAGAFFAAVVLFASVAAAILAAPADAHARIALRLGAAVYAALGLAGIAAAFGGAPLAMLYDRVALLAFSFAGPALAAAALAGFDPAIPRRAAGPAVVFVALAALLTAAIGAALAAYAIQAGAILATLGIAGRARRKSLGARFYAALGALALGAGAFAFASGDAEGRLGFHLFAAAGLLGTAQAIRGAADRARA